MKQMKGPRNGDRRNMLTNLTAGGEFSGLAVANTKGMCDEEGLR
jgi:hypothetical protein